jgi:hypothetical protein
MITKIPKKYQLMLLAILILLVPTFLSACNTTPQYSTFEFTHPTMGFRVDYPKGWSTSSEPVHTEAGGQTATVTFGKPKSSLEIEVMYDTILSYQEWFSIFNSPMAADKLEIKDAREGATAYSTFTQMGSSTSANEFSRIYIVVEDIGTVLIFCSYDNNSVTSEERNLIQIYALHIIDSFKIGNSKTG